MSEDISSGLCLRTPEGVEALVMVETSTGSSPASIIKNILDLPNVTGVNEISGEFDAVAFVKANSIEELNSYVDLIRETRGVSSTVTRIILSELYIKGKEEPPKDIQTMVMVISSTGYYTSKVAQALLKNPAVKKIYEISGKHDIVAFIGTKNIAELNKRLDELREVEGVTKTITYLILK
ncbi:MAG: Lrp/AsnC ligand binding domain-containing protein [Candidatus Lokiarchaeia archaeon]